MSNNRQETRLDRNETIFIEIKNSYGDESPDEMLICNSVDLSANGIRALIDRELPVHAIYQMCIEIHSTLEKLHLVAETKWLTKADDEDGFYVGLAILESDETDVERWKRYIAAELENPQ